MDVPVLVKQCSCSVDQPVILEPASTSHTLTAAPTQHCRSSPSVALLPLLQSGTAADGAENKKANVFTSKYTYRLGEITFRGLQSAGMLAEECC